MARVFKRIETYVCDFCGEECIPRPIRSLRYIHSQDGRGRAKIISMQVGGTIPLRNPNPDVCSDCVRDAMNDILNRLPPQGEGSIPVE